MASGSTNGGQASPGRTALLARLFKPRPGAGPRDNVVVVTRRDLFPADHGAAVRIVETARGLSRHGCRVGIVSEDRKCWWLFDDGVEQRCRLPFWLRLLSLPRSLAWLLHQGRDLPRSNRFLYLPLSDRAFFWNCLYVGRRLNAGILQAEFPAYAKPCIEARDVLGAAVVLVEHNVEYARLKAQVAGLSGARFHKLRALEIDLCNRCDAVVCVSDQDRQRLVGDGVNAALLHTIPHGFDPGLYEAPARDSVRKAFGMPEDAVLIGFHGTFSYPPNLDALRVFADELLPRLARGRRPFHVVAIGPNPPAQKLHPDIHCTGSVDSIGPWLKACDLAVVPLLQGGGTRMKIIDCFAAGLPVISTAKGIEGIPVTNGREAVICDDWGRMAEVVTELAESEQRRRQLSGAALDFVAGMDWNSICRRYLDVFATIRKTPRP